MAGVLWQMKLLSSWWPEAERQIEKGPGPNIPFKGMFPLTQLPSSKPNLLIVPPATHLPFNTRALKDIHEPNYSTREIN
jgi:hypothetical protein